MKVLQVSDDDLPGRHFNGYDLIGDLAPHGIAAEQVVLRKDSDSPNVVPLLRSAADEELQSRLIAAESRHSITNLLFPWGRVLAQTPQFQQADVVHYHLIHRKMISLYDMKWLFGLKPTVWTFHDPWPMTGHCIHPMQCEGWLTGCEPCPYLDRMFPMIEDNAGPMWRVKQRVYADLDIDVVVASEWMSDMVRRSPLTSHLEYVHVIPFGVDTRIFLEDSKRPESRERLGIGGDDFVLLARASPWEVKGLDHIVQALTQAPPNRPTTVIAVDHRGLMHEVGRNYRVIELGWVNDDDLYAAILSACDVLVMPSLAESFGLMAVEAMAAGRPVVCFEGTALPAITGAPECGIAVPYGDAAALRAALDRLALNPAEALNRGGRGRMLVAERYGHDQYLGNMADLYRSVVGRQAAKGRGVLG